MRCRVCQKKFSSRHLLMQHVNTDHSQKEPSQWEARDALPLIERVALACGQERFADCYFIVGPDEKRIPAHRFVLAIASPVFELMLYEQSAGQKGPPRIRLPHVDPVAFNDILRFLYTGELNVTASTIVPLLVLARRYSLSSVATICRQFASTRVPVDAAPALIRQLAVLGEDTSAVERVLLDEGELLLNSSALLSVPRDLLASLLANTALAAKEVTVFKAVKRWGTKAAAAAADGKVGGEATADAKEPSTEALRAAVAELLPHVRFPLMGIEDLAEEVVNSGLLPAEECLSLFQRASVGPELKHMVGTPLSFSATPRAEFNRVRGSAFLSAADGGRLAELFADKPALLRLLWSSQRDGQGLEHFHKLCDNQGPTLTVISSNKPGYLGGFNPNSWGSQVAPGPDSWLFVLDSAGPAVKLRRVEGKSENKSAHSNAKPAQRGPSFPPDLTINDTTMNMKLKLALDQYEANDAASRYSSFTVKNMEVYAVLYRAV